MSNQHGPRFAKETLQGQQHQIHLVRKIHLYQRKCPSKNVGTIPLAIITPKTIEPISQSRLACRCLHTQPSISRDTVRYGCSKPKRGILASKLSSHKVQSVWQQLQSTYLSQGSMYLLCICPSLHDYIRSRFHKKQTATIQATKVIPDLPATLNNCASSRQKKTWKQTHHKSFLFQVS